MLIFLIKRIIQAMLVMLVISMVVFSVKDSLGDPVRELVGESVSELEKEQIREEMGLNDPFLVQYSRFIKNALKGDLGYSLYYGDPTLKVILSKLPATLELVFATTIIVLLLSIPLGMICAIIPKSVFSKIIMSVSIIGISIPIFLTAIILISIFSIWLGWLPSFGRGEVVHIWGYWESNFFSLNGIKHIILPSIALSSIMLPLFIRLVRVEMLDSLQSDYIRFAWAKGLKPLRIYLRHAFRNTLLPLVTVGGIQIGILIAYTIITERVFQWPGMGFIFLEAINRSDTPLILAYIIFIGLVFVIVNTIVDVIYVFINPRIRIQG